MMHFDHCGGLALHGELSFADSCLLFNLVNCREHCAMPLNEATSAHLELCDA